VLGGLGLAVLIARVASYLEHREKVRLERLVEQRTQELNAGVQADLHEIRAAGLRARDLVAQILTFSRQHNVKLVPLDLSAPVTEALKLVRASTPATIEIVARLTSGTVMADSTQIHQVVVNLCSNAVHAMRSRPGRLEISLDRTEVADSLAAEVPSLQPGPAMRLTVADAGTGMDATTLERIFDPFFTTKPPGEGTGLGLAIVQGIVHSHHGAVRVRSVPGSGTTFELFFPLTDATAALSPPPDSVPLGNGEEILVVDDDRSVAAFVKQRLSQLGYRPTVFNDPRAALVEVAAAPRRFHAIVTDHTMPGLTGEQLIRQCRAAGADLPAVLITGYGTDALHSSLHSLPGCTMLSKPFNGDDLVRVLNRLLGGNHPS
jgi:CheY-like chemotaxis protein